MFISFSTLVFLLQLGPERNYEILCKALDHEAQAVLEVCL